MLETEDIHSLKNTADRQSKTTGRKKSVLSVVLLCLLSYSLLIFPLQLLQNDGHPVVLVR